MKGRADRRGTQAVKRLNHKTLVPQFKYSIRLLTTVYSPNSATDLGTEISQFYTYKHTQVQNTRTIRLLRTTFSDDMCVVLHILQKIRTRLST